MPSVFKTKEKEILDKITNGNQDNPDLICDLCQLMNLEKEKPDLTGPEIDTKLNSPHSSLDDDRAEIYEAIQKLQAHDPPATEVIDGLKKNLNAVVMVTIQQYLLDIDHKSSNYVVRSTDLKNRDFLIDKKPYYFNESLKIGGQRSANALGTGFFYKREEVVVIKKEGQEDREEKIDRYFIITAAHVVFPPFMKIVFSDLRFVSSYWVRNQNINGLTKNSFDKGVSIPKNQVFKPAKAKPEYFRMSSNAHDFAIVEVVPETETNAFPKNITNNVLTEDDLFDFSAFTNEALLSEKVYGLGHGFGLPLKFSPCGNITKCDDQFLGCDLDFYTGNSGSPVFDSKTNKLMGVLLRGQRDVYFDELSDTLKPGVSFGNGKGELCQKNQFLVDFESMGMSKAPPSSSPTQHEITTQEFLPYIHLQQGIGAATSLFVCMTSANRKVTFENELKQFSDISIATVKLSRGGFPNTFVNEMYTLPASILNSEGEKTVEIRILDQLSGLTHVSVLNKDTIGQIDVNISNNSLSGKIYWAVCTPKAHFEKGKEAIIGFSVGYLDGEQFIHSPILNISNTENHTIHFSINTDNLEEVGAPADFTIIVKKGILPYIIKPTSIGGRDGP